MNKKSVVQIIDTLESGGAEKVLIMLSNLLYANGHNVKVICTLNSGSIANQLNSNIQQVALHRKNKFSLFTMYKLVKECSNYEIVHVHSRHNLLYLFVAATIFRLNKKIFFHEHFGNIDVDKSVKWYQKIIYPQVKYIAVSRSLQQWALHILKLSPSSVFLLPNTIEKINSQSSHVEKTTASNLKLLLVSNFRRSKNIEFAIEVASALQQQNIAFILTIIGQVADVSYYTEIKELINNHNLASNINIVHDCYNIQPVLSQYHLALHTAKTESGPLVLIEYMAQGLPFLAFKTGEVVDEIINDVPELIMKNFSVNDWIYKIINYNDLITLKQNLLLLYDKKFSLNNYYQQCIKIYNS